jgi:hypothetical protein
MSDYKLEVDEHGFGGIVGPGLAEMTDRVAKSIAADYDGKVRQALIQLGWVPPDQAAAALEEAAKVAEQSNMPGGSGTLIAAAIRELKEK